MTEGDAPMPETLGLCIVSQEMGDEGADWSSVKRQRHRSHSYEHILDPLYNDLER